MSQIIHNLNFIAANYVHNNYYTLTPYLIQSAIINVDGRIKQEINVRVHIQSS